MARRRAMAALGRKGGLRGGPARARALTASRRAQISRQAAAARWAPMPLRFERRPRNAAELLTFVAHFGTRVARSRLGLPLEAIAMAAARAARRDPSLARMLPVFLWRIRGELDLDELIKLVKGSPDAPVLGYFLELAGELGSFGPFRRRVSALRDDVRRNRPMYLFAKMARNPFERLAAETRTPEAARRWGLLTGTPTDSFESYFRKVAGV